MIKNKIAVVYSPKMSAKNKSFSPSSSKPEIVIDDWKSIPGISEHLEFRHPIVATENDICLAHNRDYVYNVLRCREANGFGKYDAATAFSLPYTTGAMITGAKIAIKENRVVCVPVSGFHHATYNDGGGFCTFNGLMVAALKVLNVLAKKVSILDCDMHYGNGTASIIKKFRLYDTILHYSAGKHYHSPDQAIDFLKILPSIVRCMAENSGLIIYQAGADCHIDDPLGGWLTTEQIQQRDRIVFKIASEYNIPIVWNLAGGYQQEKDGSIPRVVEIHRNTMCEAIKNNL